MIKLVLAIGIATALWPVDEHNRPLSVGSPDISAVDVMSAGYSILNDVAGFCERNVETCQTASTLAANSIGMVQSKISGTSEKFIQIEVPAIAAE